MNNLDSSSQANTKLEKETTNLSILRESVDKYHNLSSEMSEILTVFENRLGKLEKTILPVYQETDQLQKRQQNLDATLNSLSTVLAHYDVSQDVCNLVHQGPTEGVGIFLEALGRLRSAMEYFLHHNSQSVELENVTSLFNTGCEGLNNHYRLLLKKNGMPLKPVEVLDLIYNEDDSSNDDYTSFRQLSQSTREELFTISHWLEQNLRFEYTVIYAYERGDVVLKSLQNLKDHQKSNSWGNEALKSRHSGRPEVKKNTSARLQAIFERKANKLYLKATQTLEQSTGISIKKASSHAEHLSSDEFAEQGGDQELDKYLLMLLALQRLLNWERALMQEIIPTSKRSEVFAKLAYKSIDMVVKDAEAITSRIMRSISRKEWTSALGIFKTLKNVILLQPDIDRTYDQEQREQLTKVLNKLQYTGSKALEHFLEVVRGESSTNIVGIGSSTLGYVNVPRDATVHELTSNTIWFIEHLLNHYDVIGVILQPDVLYSTLLETILMKKQLSEDERNKALLAIYIKKALAELNLSIMNKCEQFNDQATKHLFRLNNINYILNSLITSNLIDIVSIAEPDCRTSYVETIKELKFSYQKTWSKMLGNITPLDELPKPVQGKVKDKDRSILKERFLMFNKDFEEACKIQRGICIPDVTLRQSIKRDNEEHILPKYNEFFNTYAAVNFSKNPEKYVRYKPHEVKANLNKLFDDSA